MPESRGNKFTRICNTIGNSIIEIIAPGNGWPGIASCTLNDRKVNVALHVSSVGSMSRKPHELRFQNPGQNKPVISPDTSIPILMGEAEDGILVMADGSSRVNSNARFSILFNRRVIDEAKETGWSVYINSKGDRIYAFHPSLFDVALNIVSGNSDVIPPNNIRSIIDTVGVNTLDIPEVKERVRRSANVLVRHHAFSKNVRAAYRNCCAMCGVNMGVVVGAHIYPAAAPDSVDHAINGLALCQNHHTVFDNHQIWIEPSTKTIKFHPDIILEGNASAMTKLFIEGTYPTLATPEEIELSPLEEMFEKRNNFFDGRYDWV
jgi:hypothetical protein